MSRRPGAIALALSVIAATLMVAVSPPAQAAGIGRMTGRIMVNTVPSHTPCTAPRIIVYLEEGGLVFASGTPDGRYAVENLPTGQHMVVQSCQVGDWVQETFRNRPGFDFAGAEPVNILEGITTSQINAVLDAGGTISGHIGKNSGAPIPDCGSVAWPVSQEGVILAGAPCPDPDTGNYTIHGVPKGRVFVQFVSPNGLWVEEWWKNEPDITTAKLVKVVVGTDTPGIDAAIKKAAPIRTATRSVVLPDGSVVPAPG